MIAGYTELLRTTGNAVHGTQLANTETKIFVSGNAMFDTFANSRRENNTNLAVIYTGVAVGGVGGIQLIATKHS